MNALSLYLCLCLSLVSQGWVGGSVGGSSRIMTRISLGFHVVLCNLGDTCFSGAAHCTLQAVRKSSVLMNCSVTLSLSLCLSLSKVGGCVGGWLRGSSRIMRHVTL